MERQVAREFGQRLSPFLSQRIEELKRTYGEESRQYRGLAAQYLFDEREREIDWKSERRRHYEAELLRGSDGEELRGLERLYRRVALIDLTTACTSFCRYCLRKEYADFTLSERDIERAAIYFGSRENRDELREVLITGGDPCLLPDLLRYALDSIAKNAPNIEIVRIGSRLPVQEPSLVNEALLSALCPRVGLRVELATQVNHPIELCKESRTAYGAIRDLGVTIYNQQVLLNGVNDDLETLVELYDAFRYIGIEAHYMFHCVPVHGVAHLRTSVEKGLVLARGLTSSGMTSGRAKPMYTAMTDIGKVTFYDGCIADRRGDMVLLHTEYTVDDRKRWNPSWNVPDSTVVDAEGRMSVWYKDSVLHNEGWPTTYITEDAPSFAGKAFRE